MRRHGFLPAPAQDQTAHRLLEAGWAEAAGSGEVAAVAVDDDAQRGGPGAGAERLPGGVQRDRPDAVEQVAHLLELATDLGEQLVAAGAEVPQPGPRLIDRFRFVAAQLGRQPGDEDRVFLVGLIDGQVLGPPGPRGEHRLHADERHAPVGSELPKHPPPVPGRLT